MSTILVVDDDASDRTLLSELLTRAGHTVTSADGGHSALRVIGRKEPIDIIITDLKMPGINGLRLIRQIRQKGDQIPIIAISGTNADQLLLAQDYGANAGLVKPVDPAELLDVVTQVASEARDDWQDAWIHPEFGNVADR